ncbi:MAG: hypothetical protein HYY24_05510 [Verrucomicrobia bacterium]|nr:hypothetical protein [Verrucomicrobiota bacterium]
MNNSDLRRIEPPLDLPAILPSRRRIVAPHEVNVDRLAVLPVCWTGYTLALDGVSAEIRRGDVDESSGSRGIKIRTALVYVQPIGPLAGYGRNRQKRFDASKSATRGVSAAPSIHGPVDR